MNRIREAQEYAATAMAASQQIMEEQANRKRSPAPMFRKGDKVWLNFKNVSTPQPKKKLAWICAKYTITKVISPLVVELDVPSGIHSRFHVQFLRQAGNDPLPSQIVYDAQPPPVLPEILDDPNEVHPQFIEVLNSMGGRLCAGKIFAGTDKDFSIPIDCKLRGSLS
ncbi:hypothetical protein K3495_g7034 [Podosphaera aphanis]|nr:hypothetical protein K3495_g7034 [Podosphaera aphanis]